METPLSQLFIVGNKRKQCETNSKLPEMKNSIVYLRRSEVSDFSSLLSRQHNAKVLTIKIKGDVETSNERKEIAF